MPLELSQGNCKYTPLTSTTGTNTVNAGPLGSPGVGQQGVNPSSFSVFYGVNVAGLGTNTTTGTATGGQPVGVAAYDVIQPSGLGTNTATLTNLLASGTASSANAFIGPAGPSSSLGVRYQGALVIVLSGATSFGGSNCLWD
jgi:hypothetical protein